MIEQQIVQSLRVTNHNDFKIVDRFDGVPYTFDINTPNTIPLDAALHIFGWSPDVDPEDLFRHTQRRFGWNTPAMEQNGSARRFFGRLKIEPVIYKLVEIGADGEPATKTSSIIAAPGEVVAVPGPDAIPQRKPHNKLMETVDERIQALKSGS